MSRTTATTAAVWEGKQQAGEVRRTEGRCAAGEGARSVLKKKLKIKIQVKASKSGKATGSNSMNFAVYHRGEGGGREGGGQGNLP